MILVSMAECEQSLALSVRKGTNNCGIFQIFRLHSCFLLLAGTTSAILRASLVELPGEIDQERATGGVVNRQFADAIDSGIGFVGVEEVNTTHIEGQLSQTAEVEVALHAERYFCDEWLVVYIYNLSNAFRHFCLSFSVSSGCIAVPPRSMVFTILNPA